MTSAGCRVCRHSGRFHVPLSLAIALRLLYIGLSVETAEELRILGEVFFGFFVELLPGLFVPDAKSFQGGSEHDVFFQAGVFAQHRREENTPLLINRAFVCVGEIKGFHFEKIFVKTGFLHQFLFKAFPFHQRVHIQAAKRVEDKFSDDQTIILEAEQKFSEFRGDTHSPLLIDGMLKTSPEHGLTPLPHFAPLCPTTIALCFFAVKKKV